MFQSKSEEAYDTLQPLLVYTCIAYYCIYEWDLEIISNQIEVDNDTITKRFAGHSTTFVKQVISRGRINTNLM